MFGTPAGIESYVLLGLGFVVSPVALALLSCSHRRMIGDDLWLPNGVLVTMTIMGINVFLAVPVYILLLIASIG